MLKDSEEPQSWDLTPNMREEFSRHQPTMFSDITSTVPNNTMTQQMLEEEYGLGVSQAPSAKDGSIPFVDTISSLSYSPVTVMQDELQVEIQQPVPVDVPTEPLYQDQYSEYIDNHQAIQYEQPEQWLHFDGQDHLSKPDFSVVDDSEIVKLQEEHIELQEPIMQEPVMPEPSHNQKPTRAKRIKKKLSSLIDSDVENTPEKPVEPLPKASKKRKASKAKRTKTSPAAFGQASTELAVDVETLADIKQRLAVGLTNSSQSPVSKPSITVENLLALETHDQESATDLRSGENQNVNSQMVENGQIERGIDQFQKDNVLVGGKILETANGREPLQEIHTNSLASLSTDTQRYSVKTLSVANGQEVVKSPKLPMLTSFKSTESPDATGKTPYRVGLSKRARIAPLLKSFRK
jgi:hypothetical protein